MLRADTLRYAAILLFRAARRAPRVAARLRFAALRATAVCLFSASAMRGARCCSLSTRAR